MGSIWWVEKTLKGLCARGCKRETQITSVSWSSTETLFVPEVIHHRNMYSWCFPWNLRCSVSSLTESHEQLWLCDSIAWFYELECRRKCGFKSPHTAARLLPAHTRIHPCLMLNKSNIHRVCILHGHDSGTDPGLPEPPDVNSLSLSPSLLPLF